ncbi:MAG: RNA 2',3'-cyclic phosphodiesterase [Clostridia bacterium]|nr:RNA 2',3'-cyclic phosphodiesterase [Clostridia bacterium]MBQ7475244.1 RNA 2',3'-cyclic phosphodiesterase [Clostridia bacterium]
MRLFIALPFEGAAAEALSRTQDALRRAGVKGNYTKKENFHVTLAFIGEYPDPDRVLDVMSGVPFSPVTLRLDGLGAFDGVWWAGVGVPETLSAYVRRLRRALADAGIPTDKKKFNPHVTLIRRPDRAAIPPVPPPSAAEEFSGVSLFRSDRGRDGMIYTEIGYVK